MPDPHAEYTKRLAKYEAIAASKNRLHIRIGNIKLAAVAAGLLVAWLAFHEQLLSGRWLFAPVAIYLILAVVHEKILRSRTRAETAASYYRKGIGRMEDRWSGGGQTGERFRDENHVYSADLDIFGSGSLFELLSTARLPMGENKLASWLLAPSPEPEILERQTLVAELRPKLDLHEDLALTGEELRARLNPESLVDWAESPRALPGAGARFAAVALAIAFVAAIIFSLRTSEYAPILIVLVIEILFRRWLLRRAESVIGGLACNAEGLLLFAEILQRLEREPFAAPCLQGIAATLSRGAAPASTAIRRLARIVYWIDAHHSLLAHIVELPLLYTVQVAFAAETWRQHFGPQLRAWVDIAGEMEALLSLATYSFEHPADPFPEFAHADSATSAYFSGSELGHPLIAVAKCVRNSVTLDSATRVILISGSNMSGKSTLLRTVGINTVLAMAGAPVRAKSLRLSPLTIGTRTRSTDSLQEGRSTFYTEILHIRRVFDIAGASVAAAGAPPLLFLFDELLEGTNSHDRRIGAESLIRGLLQRHAIGITSLLTISR